MEQGHYENYLQMAELFKTHMFHKEVITDNATNTFIQQIRRRLSILERPLTTARGDGKSYIYSNFNPKYAQIVITILRTYSNFCFAFNSNGITETPPQRLGITDKKLDLKDIIYLR